MTDIYFIYGGDVKQKDWEFIDYEDPQAASDFFGIYCSDMAELRRVPLIYGIIKISNKEFDNWESDGDFSDRMIDFIQDCNQKIKEKGNMK